MENLEEKKGPTSESSPVTVISAPQTPRGGKKATTGNTTKVMTVMTPEETADLLARLQDILALWPGSSNMIVEGKLLAAFPMPPEVMIGKTTKVNGHDKVFTVNKEPVVSLEEA